MIIDQLSNAHLYFGVHPRIERSLKWLMENDLAKLNVGRYEIQGEDIYAMVQAYQTIASSESYPEAHRQYIDVQYLVAGKESMGFVPKTSLKVYKAYVSEEDYELFDTTPDYTRFTAGMFAVYFPGDAHQPRVIYDQSEKVKKIVIKVKFW